MRHITVALYWKFNLLLLSVRGGAGRHCPHVATSSEEHWASSCAPSQQKSTSQFFLILVEYKPGSQQRKWELHVSIQDAVPERLRAGQKELSHFRGTCSARTCWVSHSTRAESTDALSMLKYCGDSRSWFQTPGTYLQCVSFFFSPNKLQYRENDDASTFVSLRRKG